MSNPPRHFINQYPGIVSKVDVRLVKDLWTRIVNKDSHGRMAQHNHAFVKVGPHNTYTQYVTRLAFDCFGLTDLSLLVGCTGLIMQSHPTD